MAITSNVNHIGFTGTRHGMTSKQKASLNSVLKTIVEDGGVVYFHHGDCIGADEQAHDIAGKLGCTIIIHPPEIDKARAFCETAEQNLCPKKSYLERNRDIVDVSIILLGCPNTDIERLRSGTWATIRYAKKQFKEVIVIYPSGSKEWH